MTSLVDMKYTLLAPLTCPSYDSESDSTSSSSSSSSSSEEGFPVVEVKLENDPLIGNSMEFWNNELMRLGDELSKYGVTDIFMQNKKSPEDIPSFPDLFPCVEDISSESEFFADIDMDIESETESLGRFSCCCSEQCRSYDSSSDWSYPSSPRSFGMPSIRKSDNLFSFPIQPNDNYIAPRQDLTDLTPFNFTSCLLKEQNKPDERIKSEPTSEMQYVPIQMETETTPISEESSEVITPSPVHTEDEGDSTDCTYKIMSHVSDVKLEGNSTYQETKKKRMRLNSVSSDSDQSEDYVKEPSPRKRSGKLKNRTDSEVKNGAYKPKQLYQFLMDLLRDEEYCPQFIEWVSRDEKVFRLVDSAAVARMWGECKNRENMTYEKMSRALRYYYENGILERVPNCRLHYRFGKTAYEEYASTW